MPYKHRDPFHRYIRTYLAELKDYLAPGSIREYSRWLGEAADILGPVNPKTVSVVSLRKMEKELRGNSTSKNIKCHVLRKFLTWAGNQDAVKWRIQSRQLRKLDRVFLIEGQVSYVRKVAHEMGPEHELLFSLGVDCGLRRIDMIRLTMRNVRDLLSTGYSMIRSKGRGGGKYRPMLLNMMTKQPLFEYLALRRELTLKYGREFEDFLISFNRNKGELLPMSSDQLSSRVEKISQAASVKFRSHDQRATFGNRLWKRGTKIETIAELMGHESINQTFKAYIGIQISDMQDAMDLLVPVD